MIRIDMNASWDVDDNPIFLGGYIPVGFMFEIPFLLSEYCKMAIYGQATSIHAVEHSPQDPEIHQKPS